METLSPTQQFEQIKAQVTRTSAEEIVKQFAEVAVRVENVRLLTDRTIETTPTHTAPQQYDGEVTGDSAKAKVTDTKTAVQKVLLAVQMPIKDIPVGDTRTTPEIKGNAHKILKSLSSELQSGAMVSEQSSPYIYALIQKVIAGGVTSVDQLVAEFDAIRNLQLAEPGIYRQVQKALVEAAQSMSTITREQAETKFHVQQATNTPENQQQQANGRTPEEIYQEHDAPLGQLMVRIRVAKSLTAEKAESIINKLKYAKESVTTDELRTVLTGVTPPFSDEDLAHLVQYSNEFKVVQERRGNESTHYLTLYKIMEPELKQAFTIEGIRQYIVDDPEHPGQKLFSSEGKRYLKRRALGALNKLMANVDNQPDIDFHQNFSDLREGQAYFELQNMIGNFQSALLSSAGLKTELGEKGIQDLNDYITRGVKRELSNEKNLRELFHTMGIYIKQLPPEKYGEFLSRYNLSDIDSVVTSDFSGKIISLAMSEYERYLQFDRMKNNGKLRTSLFAGKSNLDLMYTNNEDRTILRERIKATLNGLKRHIGGTDPLFTDAIAERIKSGTKIQRWDLANIGEFQEWEIDRALKYAQGIHLTQTIRGFETMASGRPPDHFRGSADNMVDMAGVFNPNWRWQTGRGGAKNMPRYREAMTADMIIKRPERSLGKRIMGDLFGKERWDPEDLHEKFGKKAWNTEEKMLEKWGEIKDKWLYRDTDYRKMMKLLGLGGLAGRAGWRLTGFKGGVDAEGSEYSRFVTNIQEAILKANGEINDVTASSGDFKESQAVYEQLARSVGVGSRFFFDADRAASFGKEELWKYLKAQGGFEITDTPARELDKLWEEYRYGEHGNDDILTLPGGEKVTLMELIDIKTLMLRGLNFRDLMKRSPLDFLNSLINITPELLTKEFGGVGDEYFIFNEHELEQKINSDTTKSKGEKEELLMIIKVKQAEMRRMWGTDKEENQKHLLEVRKFYSKVYAWGLKRLNITPADITADPTKAPSKEQIDKEIWEPIYRAMDLAIEKVRLHNSSEMNPDYIQVFKADGTIDDELTKDLRAMFFGAEAGKEGLVTYFNALNERCGVNGKTEVPVSDLTEGDRGFFYHMGRSWYNELGHNFPPDTSDVDWRYILHNMGANSGENMVKRLWGDLSAYNGVMSKLSGLDDLLAKCAASNSLDKIMELHEGIRGLKGIAGDESVYEMQYYLAQLVIRYFQENSNARMPFLLGAAYGAFNGKNISLSRIYGGMHAMTLKTDGINEYIQKLEHSNFIAEEGIFGPERLMQAVGADWQKLVVAEIIPNVSTALMLFLLYKYIKDASDEAAGKKKK